MSVRIGPLSIMSILNEPILIFISHKRWPKYDKHPFRKRVGACPVYVGQTQRNKRFKSYPTKTLTKIETYRIQRSISLVPVLCKHAHSSPNGQERDVNSYGRVLGSSWSFYPVSLPHRRQVNAEHAALVTSSPSCECYITYSLISPNIGGLCSTAQNSLGQTSTSPAL